MAGSIHSNMSGTASQVIQQKTGTTRQSAKEQNDNLSAEDRLSGRQQNDTVTLNRTGKPSGQSKVLDAQAVQQVLPQTRSAIVTNSKTALAAQANFNPQAVKDMLADQ